MPTAPIRRKVARFEHTAIVRGCGLVITQEVGEADYDGMPQSAIATGDVDLVLFAAKIAEALVNRAKGAIFTSTQGKLPSQDSVQALLPKITDLLRTKTVHDFTHYKHGTLERRVERRMGMAGIKTAGDYPNFLLRDSNEREQLSRDLLINVTGFFRDAPVFDLLEKNVTPNLVCESDREFTLLITGNSMRCRADRHSDHTPNDNQQRGEDDERRGGARAGSLTRSGC